MSNEPNDRGAAERRMADLKRRNPNATYTVTQGKKSGKWHVVHHTSGGMRMVEDTSFDSYLAEATTLAKINKALKAAHLDLEVVKGRGYWYFAGKDANTMRETGIYAWNILKSDPSEIVDEAKSRIDK